MAVTSTDTKTGPYTGNGSTTVFPFTFDVVSADDVAVDVDGLRLNTGAYSVDLANKAVILSQPLASGSVLYAVSDPSFEQQIQFENGSRWLAGPVNEANDRAAIRDLYLLDKVRRSPQLPFIPTTAAGRFPVVDAAGNWAFSSGTGADAGLRADLALAGGALIGASLPGFPAIVKTLGDALPYISPGEFFGIKSDGADDTLALRSAIEAVANRSNGPGGVLSLKPGGTTRTGDQTIVKPFVVLELNGGTIQPNLNGGNTAGLRMMSDATVRGGMIDVRSTGSPGIQVPIHSPILLGVPYGEGGTVASPSALDNVSRALIEDMVLLSNKDLGPVASGGATGIHLVGNVHDCVARRIRIPANNKMQGAIGIDWGIRGEVAGAQAIFSDPTKMAQNRTNFDAGYAFTTHPHDNHFSDFLIEALSRPYQVGIVDSGTFAGRNSGGYGNSFRRFHALQTTESGAVSHVGDLGFEFAKGADLARAFLGNVFEDFVIEEVGTGVGIKSDSDADNVRRAISDYAYSARFAPTWKTDIVFNRVKARTTNAVDGEQGGLYCFRQNGGTFVDIDMRGFGIGARYVGATDITDTGGRYTFSKRQNISLEGGCARIEFVNLRDVSYGNRIGATYSNIHFQSADLCAIRGGSVGAMASDESARHAILLNAPADGNQRTTLSGVRINSHGSGGFGIVAASSSAWGTLQVIENITYGSFVTNTYTGELAQPIRRRGAGLGADYVMPQAGNLTDTLSTLSGKSVLQGETFDYSNPAAGGKKGLVAVATGPASSTTLKPFGAIDA